MPRHAVAKELPLPRSRHCALGRINFQLQFLLQKRRNCLHLPLSCALASDVDVAVIRITAEAQPAPLQFPVKIVEQNIR